MLRAELYPEFRWRNVLASPLKKKKKEEPVRLQDEPYVKSYSGRRIAFTFNNYISISSERFVSETSRLLQKGKIVEIDCGFWGESWLGNGHDDELPEVYCGIYRPPESSNQREWTKFIASKVLNSDVIERISKQVSEQNGMDLEVNVRFFYNKGKHWWSLQQRHLFIVIENANSAENATQLAPFEKLADIIGNPNQLKDKSDCINNDRYSEPYFGATSRYTDAPVLEINGPIFFADLRNLVEEKGIVEIKRTDFSGVPETYGMFVEAGMGKNEIIINLNGQDEAHFEDIFVPIVLYFMQKGKTVLVEWWGDEDIGQLEDKVEQSEIYNLISKKTRCNPVAERLVISPYSEEDTFIRLEPNSLL